MPGRAQGFRERTARSQVTVEITGLTKLIKSSTEKRQPSDYLISLDQQHCLADVAQGEPGVECMLSRMVDQHRDKAFRCIQIAD